MNIESIQNICETRLLVGYLGEKQQKSWWDSSFLSTSSKAFLSPIFPKSMLLAQYNGVCQAAMIIHDEHIGVGKHFHLYRLPDSIEYAIIKCIQSHNYSEYLEKNAISQETAIKKLEKLNNSIGEKTEGPVMVGNYSDHDLERLINAARAHYLAAFQQGYKTFPYMRCE